MGTVVLQIYNTTVSILRNKISTIDGKIKPNKLCSFTNYFYISKKT